MSTQLLLITSDLIATSLVMATLLLLFTGAGFIEYIKNRRTFLLFRRKKSIGGLIRMMMWRLKMGVSVVGAQQLVVQLG